MNDELRPEYDLRQLLKAGVRGKYAKRYHAGTNRFLLEPNIRKAFRSERAVNQALRLVLSCAGLAFAKLTLNKVRQASRPVAWAYVFHLAMN